MIRVFFYEFAVTRSLFDFLKRTSSVNRKIAIIQVSFSKYAYAIKREQTSSPGRRVRIDVFGDD